MPSLTARGIRKSFDRSAVLTDIDLDLPQGAFLALLGPSGCGKTTLLRLIAGLETADAGELRLDDRVVLSPRTFVAPEDRNLGMVFQSYALWPNMTVRGNVEFALKARRMAASDRRARVDAMLRTVGLTPHADRRPHELSGGQRQRVALARSLVLRPAMLLLDEPLANLDTHLRQQMLVEFRRLHAETGATFILVTHDQDEAMTVASHIAVMDGGRIQQIGTPETLYRRPATPMVARFIGHGATIPVQVTARRNDQCDVLLGSLPLTLPGRADPGAGWLCLHPDDLCPATGPGHFEAQVIAHSFRNGRHATLILPRIAGTDTLTLSLDEPLPPQSTIRVQITGGWIIGRDADPAPVQHADRMAMHA
ncbi:ABC transporter ATP-binding protein [Paracoccus sp. Ld10]|uniref:ABC transporter ATP-binding protein n=1 Tax=Paracoccus sp. Ld10 TaxID=649158 RepID=UPI00386BB3F7